MESKAVQEFYPDELNYCFGCGQRNDRGLHIQTYVDGDETIATHIPGPYYLATPGFVYGGLIASLIDCHGTGTAAAAAYRAAGRELGSDPPLRFLTAALHVDYLKPTPMGVPLELRGRATEVKGRKVVVEITLSAAGQLCARGEVVAVQVPDDLVRPRTAVPESMPQAMTIKGLMAHLLEFSFYKESWQPSLSMAIEGLSVRQAAWKPAPQRHCIWQIVRHVTRWKDAFVRAWEGQQLDFQNLDQTDWQEVSGDDDDWRNDVQQLVAVSDRLMRRLQSLDEADVQGALKWYQKDRPAPFMMIRVATHDSYHAGQIRYIRALQGA